MEQKRVMTSPLGKKLCAWYKAGPAKCLSESAGKKWFEKEVERALAAPSGLPYREGPTPRTVKDATEAVRENLAQALIYLGMNEADHVYWLWGVVHPYFGNPDVRRDLRPLDYFQLHHAFLQISNGTVTARA